MYNFIYRSDEIIRRALRTDCVTRKRVPPTRKRVPSRVAQRTQVVAFVAS